MVTRTMRGRQVSCCAFDVPAEPYGPGWRTGERAAFELLRYLRDSSTVPGAQPLAAIVEEVSEALVSTNGIGPDTPSKRGAACGFLSVLQLMAQAGSRGVDLEHWEAGRMAHHVVTAARLASRRGAA